MTTYGHHLFMRIWILVQTPSQLLRAMHYDIIAIHKYTQQPIEIIGTLLAEQMIHYVRPKKINVYPRRYYETPLASGIGIFYHVHIHRTCNR